MVDKEAIQPDEQETPQSDRLIREEDNIVNRIKKRITNGQGTREVLEQLTVEDSTSIDIPDFQQGEKYEISQKVKEARKLLERGGISLKEYNNLILGILGVELDGDNAILYHATTATNLEEILRNGSIKPAEQTGNATWRTGDEDSSGDEVDLDKKRKIYLATKREIKGIAQSIQSSIPEGVYVLETRTPISNLEPDEDSGQNNWVDSLASYFQSCAYRGEINNFKIFGRLDPDPRPKREKVRFGLSSAPKNELPEVKDAVSREAIRFKEQGVNISNIPTIH